MTAPASPSLTGAPAGHRKRHIGAQLTFTGHHGGAFHRSSPVLALIVARVLCTARPPVRPALGADATIADPAGPMTFKCPLAVRSTCPPARCTAAAAASQLGGARSTLWVPEIRL